MAEVLHIAPSAPHLNGFGSVLNVVRRHSDTKSQNPQLVIHTKNIDRFNIVFEPT